MNIIKVTGTTDPAEIAAALTALQARETASDAPNAYERWRIGRLQALRRSRREYVMKQPGEGHS